MTRLATVSFSLDGKLTTFNAAQLKEVENNALEELRYSSDYTAADVAQQKKWKSNLLRT